MTTRAAVGLGSNLGDRTEHLSAALDVLSGFGKIVAVSPLYETDPVGGPAQGPYLNAVAVLDTDLPPGTLLDGCLAIERTRGRERRVRWGPRTLDMDLLIYGAETVDRPGINVPHPGLRARRFVLQPLVDAWPEARLPDGTPPARFLADVMDQGVARVSGDRWWTPPAGRSTLSQSPPGVSSEDASALALGIYGIEGDALPLAGERDRNFLIDGDRGSFSLKVANRAQDPALLDMQQAALGHLADVDSGLPVPQAVPTSAGERIGFASAEGTVLPVRMQTYLPGVRSPDGHSNPAVRHSLARLLARLDGALAGFTHPCGAHEDLWDITRLPVLRDRADHLPDVRRRLILDQMDRFEGSVLPALGGLRRQMIHSDANPANLLIDPGDPDAITGIIDFGDLRIGPLVTEVAIAAAYQCLGQKDLPEAVGGLVAAYHQHLPMTAAEIAVVPGLVAGRLVQSLIISAWRAEIHPDNRDYILMHAEPVWSALQRFAALDGAGFPMEGMR